jgi:hypothetical protein
MAAHPMIEVGPATADEMVLAFLQAEIDSPRFGGFYRDSLASMGVDRKSLIDNALPNDCDQNRIRAGLLGAVRGYQVNERLFAGFPDDVQWRRVQIEPGELAKFKYAKHQSLLDVSGASRRVLDGARNIQAGVTPREFSERVSGVVESIKRNERFPDLIAVQGKDATFVLVEGHTRATAYLINNPAYPIMVLVGSSPLIEQWAFY